jgi:hypothetical protein
MTDSSELKPGDLVLVRSDISYSMIIGCGDIEEEDIGIITDKLDEHAYLAEEFIVWDPRDVEAWDWLNQPAVNCYIRGKIYCFFECELIKIQDCNGKDSKDTKR